GPYEPAPDAGYPPIFFTSINYPGVYGMHTYGPNASVLNVAPATSMMHYPPATRETFIRTTAPNVVPGEQKAVVDVRLPANAELWFDGVKTAQSGGFRQFETPALAPVKDYHYDVRAAWSENGREVTREKRVYVRAGDHVRVDFEGTPQ